MTAHLLILLVLAAKPAQSPEEIFKSAIEDFEFGEHGAAAEKLRQILEPPLLTSKEDLIVARQYLGACYHLLDDKVKAKAQFSMLLVLDPKHKLDPEVFPPALVQFFEELRRETGLPLEKTEPKVEKVEIKKVEKKQEPEVKTELPQPVSSPPPAALALIPFGVGQFANRHPVRGVVFAVAEVGLYATAAATFAAFEGLKLPSGQFRPEDESSASSLQTAYLATFWIGVGVTAVGIIEALISYPGDWSAGQARATAAPNGLVFAF